MKLTESEAHDLAVAFAATYSKESFKYDPETVLTKLEQELASFEELYICLLYTSPSPRDA